MTNNVKWEEQSFKLEKALFKISLSNYIQSIENK